MDLALRFHAFPPQAKRKPNALYTDHLTVLKWNAEVEDRQTDMDGVCVSVCECA